MNRFSETTANEQREARRLLEAALDEGPSHAYLFYGPPGIGKRELARSFGRELLGTTRVQHPDLYELAPLGEMIRIDEIRKLHRDLHMRPFEADRRVYLILSAHLLNEDAADALLKDLEEPPQACGADAGEHVQRDVRLCGGHRAMVMENLNLTSLLTRAR